MNKTMWVNSMILGLTGANAAVFRKLVADLNSKELVALRRNEDLVARVKEISSMSQEQLVQEISEGYGLEVTSCMNGDVWIGTDALDDFRPDWAVKNRQLPFAGWYLTYEPQDNEFEPWARAFLMQEVRIEVWARYLEKKIQKSEESHQQDVGPITEDMYFGMYV